MSLVAYGSETSDSDSDEEQSNVVSNIKIKPAIPDDFVSKTEDADGELFKVLPLPKPKNVFNNVVEEDDEFLLKKEKSTEEKPKPVKPLKLSDRKPAKIHLPSLSSFDDEEDDSEEFKTRFKPPVIGLGLLSMLPKPKDGIQFMRKPSATKLIPQVLIRPGTVRPLQVIRRPPIKKILPGYNSSEGSESENEGEAKGGMDFFSLNKEAEPLPVIPAEEINKEIERYKKSKASSSIEVQQIVDEEDVESVAQEEVEIPQSDLDNEAIRKLASCRDRRKGESMQFIDINQKEILPDPKEWLTKALTDEQMTSMPTMKRKGDEPTNQQKRKHQITYLAHKARAMEKELQNQWAQNRLSRKQTQSKYGF